MPNTASEAVRKKASRQPRRGERRENLHAALSPDLLVRMEQAAAIERVSLNEFVADAIERRLNRRDLDDVLAFGRRHAKERGLRHADVDKVLRDVRAQNT